MPEGDTVWLTAHRLDEALAGRPLTVSDFRVPALATTDLRGRVVREVRARGKHLLIRVDGALTVHTHLRMDGVWRIRRAGPPLRDHRIRLALGNARWLALGYALGVVELLRTEEEDSAVGRLGPDLLGPDWDPAEAVHRLLRRPERAIGEALLDQSLLAGIGNVYKSELCFLRGVHPWRPVGETADLPGLVDLAHRLLEANKRRHGHITTGDLRPGRRHWVYGRAGRPCRRCGALIEHALQGPETGERLTFWCPRCQPRP
ncbi:DNA-formamidopyrimidine glycosylase family protein [Thermomonospora catenispora]|uniref:DNA-formamidopyrimidine glycosylase family protein n=1 Tax=Thermomonospora catenispora TaxID=2493090 RepID=UPI0011203DC7|nr:DNA-formamidopyrimidine glycosylase family protein [Thermomonospora catenispora]TNY34820.1 Fpg/Nei family DNA glycosylase [Thermomonospora catenispora]